MKEKSCSNAAKENSFSKAYTNGFMEIEFRLKADKRTSLNDILKFIAVNAHSFYISFAQWFKNRPV